MVINPAQTTAFLAVFGERGLMVFWPGFSVAAFTIVKIFGRIEWPELWNAVGCLVSRTCLQWMSRGRQLNAKNTNRVADGLILWSFQHASLAGGSSEWLGCRVGGQGDLADQYDLLSASALSSL